MVTANLIQNKCTLDYIPYFPERRFGVLLVQEVHQYPVRFAKYKRQG